VNAHIEVLTGARAGSVVQLSWNAITLGRHPSASLPFHPTLDLDVSTYHAELIPQGVNWVIRDLGSRNGTFVNGRRIPSDTFLHHGDQISLSWNGPRIAFRLAEAPIEATSISRAPSGFPEPAMAEAPAGEEGAPSHGGSEGARQTRRLRLLSGSLAVLLLAVIGVSQYMDMRQRATWDRDRLAMQLRIDSLMLTSEQVVQALEGELQGLTAALRQSQEEVLQAHAQLQRAEAGGDPSRVPALRRQLQAATVQLDRKQLAATLDFQRIERRNRPAVAMIYVEFEEGEVVTATAFAVRANATLLTSRHAVTGANGQRRPRRMAVQFADSEQAWPARLLAVSGSADLAVVKIDNILGRVPTVQPLNLRPDTLGEGAPVALIGFPEGGAARSDDGQPARLIKPVVTAGVVSGNRAGRLEVQGYGAAGASGSPVFDRNGEVVAVLFGGRRGPNGQTLFSVPSTEALRLLEEIP
jgi:S1-C subfamily serine protease